MILHDDYETASGYEIVYNLYGLFFTAVVFTTEAEKTFSSTGTFSWTQHEVLSWNEQLFQVDIQ